MVFNRNNLDIDNIKPINEVKNIKIPIYFVHAMKDTLIKSDHSLKLYENCDSSIKFINICEGGHNTIRNDNIINKIMNFFKNYLYPTNN